MWLTFISKTKSSSSSKTFRTASGVIFTNGVS
jgi:hypothetical protein